MKTNIINKFSFFFLNFAAKLWQLTLQKHRKVDLIDRVQWEGELCL